MPIESIINIKEIILLIIGICTLSGFIGGAMFYLLRTKFMPRSECSLNQDRCHERFCKSLEELKNILKEREIKLALEKDILHKRNVWIASGTTKIADKLGIELPPMPV